MRSARRASTTVNAGGTLDLGGLAQTINTVNLAGRRHPERAAQWRDYPRYGTINGIGGSASVDATGFITLEGSNGYTGATVVDVESQLKAGGRNTFSPNSATTVKSSGYARS